MKNDGDLYKYLYKSIGYQVLGNNTCKISADKLWLFGQIVYLLLTFKSWQTRQGPP